MSFLITFAAFPFIALLLNTAVILGFIFSVDVLRFETTSGFFNKELWRQVMPLFVALLTGSFLTTIIPFEPFRSWGRQARFASLQAWGLTDTWTSLYGHAFVSALSGKLLLTVLRTFLYISHIFTHLPFLTTLLFFFCPLSSSSSSSSPCSLSSFSLSPVHFLFFSSFRYLGRISIQVTHQPLTLLTHPLNTPCNTPINTPC